MKNHAPPRVIETRIDFIGAQGDGVAAIDGKRVYAPFTAPGDRVRLACRGERGVIKDLLEPGAQRVTPPCSHFGACGGCALQHISEDAYRNWKRERVVEALARERFDDDIIAPLFTCAPASRRRAAFAVRKTQNGLVFGFNAKSSSQIVSIKECVILAPALAECLPALRALAAATPGHWRSFDLAVTLCDNGVDVMLTGGDAREDLTGAETLKLIKQAKSAGIIRLSIDGDILTAFETPVVHFGGVPVAIPPGGFLQASREGEATLTAFVMSHIGNARRVADLFCGAGTFSLPLAAKAAVDGFDGDAAAIAALDAAARLGALRHPVNASRRNLFDRPLRVEELTPYDAVIFDPPRVGAQSQAAQLAQSRVPVVIGVSCNPASFARDAAQLRDGGYVLSQLLPVDQFVYSPHVELAGLFTKE